MADLQSKQILNENNKDKVNEIKVQLSAVQLCSVPDVDENLLAIERQLKKLNPIGQDVQHIVLLPECCLFFGGRDIDQLALAQQNADKDLLMNALATLAKKYQIYLVAGTIPLITSTGDKFSNSSCVFTPEGELLGRYDKIHLFDVDVADSEKKYRESHYTQAGKSVSLVTTPVANIGLSVCYDLRFPELYRQLTQLQADIITVPSAFTRVTGEAHWQALLQARAIENQVYIIAAGQEGVHANKRETWGHSMIISPWGEILAKLDTDEGIISAPYFHSEIAKVRASIPVAQHNQFTVELKNNV
jgi:predicted amidohydrolase